MAEQKKKNEEAAQEEQQEVQSENKSSKKQKWVKAGKIVGEILLIIGAGFGGYKLGQSSERKRQQRH